MCTPRPRWTAEQSIQRKIPYVTDAQVGFFALQSKHIWNQKQKMKKKNRNNSEHRRSETQSRRSQTKTRKLKTEMRLKSKIFQIRNSNCTNQKRYEPCFPTWPWVFWTPCSCRWSLRKPLERPRSKIKANGKENEKEMEIGNFFPFFLLFGFRKLKDWKSQGVFGSRRRKTPPEEI